MRKIYLLAGVAVGFSLILAACGGTSASAKTAVATRNVSQTDSNGKDSIMIPENNDSLPKSKPIDTTITKEYLMGKFDPAKDKARFELLTPPLATRNLYARKETAEAFRKMVAAAKKDGISLAVTSCVRNFDMQKSIWEAKWNSQKPVDGKILPPLSQLKGKERALKILLWNSMPGTSRHHWGTDIDINSVSPAYFESGRGKKEYAWLQAHAHEYGFCQTYSEMGAERPHGYQEEKWHWSYLPLAQEFTRTYAAIIRNEDINGFVGCEAAAEIGVVEKYVLGINPKCK
jgi:zinc D-Ala-D-Ala carboxypeptidase